MFDCQWTVVSERYDRRALQKELSIDSSAHAGLLYCLLQAVEAQQQATMKPFEGFIMSTSGGNASDKKRLAELITQGGGVYSKDLTRSCTHLLIRAAPKEGAKMSDKEK